MLASIGHAMKLHGVAVRPYSSSGDLSQDGDKRHCRFDGVLEKRARGPSFFGDDCLKMCK